MHNQRLMRRLAGCLEWETFTAINEGRPIIGGLGNTDEFVAAAWKPGFIGMSLRLFNPKTAKWSIYWVDNLEGTLQPPVLGSFEKGVGTFIGPDTFAGKPILVRFIWSGITANSARWEQAFSPDDGMSWETNWIMTFTRP